MHDLVRECRGEHELHPPALEPRAAVKGEPVIGVEIIKAEVAELMPMRRISERVARRKMRHRDLHVRAGAADAMDLFHGLDDVVEMFNDVESINFSEAGG